MQRCNSCWYGVGGACGENCPMGKFVAIGFSAGCNLWKPKEPLESPVEPCKVRGRSIHVPPSVKPAKSKGAGKKTIKEPNPTEAEYGRLFLDGRKAVYEGHTFRMANNHKYTPDWVVFDGEKPIEAHEVKGGYAMFSQGRAKLAFDQCKVEFPNVKFFWAKKLDKKKRKKDGKVWIVK